MFIVKAKLFYCLMAILILAFLIGMSRTMDMYYLAIYAMVFLMLMSGIYVFARKSFNYFLWMITLLPAFYYAVELLNNGSNIVVAIAQLSLSIGLSYYCFLSVRAMAQE
ncbi:hypothetical protein [Thalassotalea crassostreae]|uniref:hypothetical protein n=1 Tax=Thalassotalea crassostreae TaxID=1763536 RepID=UPI00083948DA|nr:hypothetical protein [Thalassotalea crassostreae]